MPIDNPNDERSELQKQYDAIDQISREALTTRMPSFNPQPDYININKELTGDPIKGPNPGDARAKLMLDNSDYVKAVRQKMSQYPISANNPYKIGQVYSFGSDYDKFNFQRYYQSPKFNELGFSPFWDNEELYNKHQTFGDEFSRASPQWWSMVGTGFSSAWNSFGDIFSGEPGAPDLKGARAMERAMAIGGSSKEGLGGWFINQYLQSGYTIGIAAELVTEELALAGLTALSGGGAAELTIPAMAARGANAFNKIRGASKIFSNTLKMMKNMRNVNGARAFYNTIKAGGRILNPLERTTDVLRGVNQIDHASDFARVSHNFGQFYRDVRDINLALSEAKLEGGSVQLEMVKRLTEEYREKNGKDPEGEDLTRIHQMSRDAAGTTILGNLPAIMYTNKFVFETVFRGFKSLGKNMDNVVDDLGSRIEFSKTGTAGDPNKFFSVVENNFRNKVKSLGKLKTYKGAGLGYLKANLAEGLQENMQEAIAGAAKDYYSDLYHNEVRGNYETFYGHLMNNASKQFSAQGLETFMSGFLMGGMVQPVQSVPFWLYRKGEQLYNREQYQEYQSRKEKETQETVDRLNEVYKNVDKYFAPEMSSMSKQTNITADLNAAEQTGDQKTFQDKKDESIFDGVHTALRMGKYDMFVDRLKDMKQLSPEELQQAVGSESPEGLHEKLDQAINRAEKIKNLYEKVESRYGQPFTPSNHKYGSEAYAASVIARQGWEEAKKAFVFSQFSLERNLQRMDAIMQDLSRDKAVKNASMSDVNVLFSPESIVNEIDILNKEVEALSQGDPLQKKLASQKKAKMTALRSFLEDLQGAAITEAGVQAGIAEVQAGKIGVGSTVNITSGKKGAGVVTNETDTHYIIDGKRRILKKNVRPQKNYDRLNQMRMEQFDKVKGSYKKYLSVIADTTNDYVFDESVDSSFDKLRDYYFLQDETKNLAKHINTLSNPEAFLDLSRRFAATHKELWDNRTRDLRDRIKNVLQNFETNEAIKKLFQIGVYVDPDQFTAFYDAVKNNVEEVPTIDRFLNVSDLTEVPKESEKYKQAQEIWNINEQLIRDQIIQQRTEEQVEQPGTETKPGEQRDVVTEGEKEETAAIKLRADQVTYSSKWDQLPEDLQKQLEPAFQKYLEDYKQKNDDFTDAMIGDLRQNWMRKNNEARGIISNWKIAKEVRPDVTPSTAPVLSTYATIKQGELETMPIDKLKSLRDTLVERQKLGEKDSQEMRDNRQGDIDKLNAYITQREGITTKVGTQANLANTLDKINAMQSSIGGRTEDQKFYIINGEPFKRVTSVIDPIEKDLTGKEDFMYPGLPKAMNVYENTVGTGKTIDQFIDALKEVNLPELNDRKYDAIKSALESENSLDTLRDVINDVAYDDSRTAGNAVDRVVRDFFINDGNIDADKHKPEAMTNEAFVQLIRELRNMQQEFQKRGLHILTENIVIFDPEAKVAGEVDMLAVDEAGKVYIFDIKTSRRDKWEKYHDLTSTKSNKIKHELQLSAYSNILHNNYDIDVADIGIIPFEITYDRNGNVTSLRLAKQTVKGEPRKGGAIIYGSPGIGKTDLSDKSGKYVDGDAILFQFLKDKDIEHSTVQDSGFDFYEYYSELSPQEKKNILKEIRDRFKASKAAGKIVLTSNWFMRDVPQELDEIYLSDNVERMATVFQNRGQETAVAEQAAKNVIAAEQAKFAGKEFTKVGPEVYIADLLEPAKLIIDLDYRDDVERAIPRKGKPVAETTEVVEEVVETPAPSEDLSQLDKFVPKGKDETSGKTPMKGWVTQYLHNEDGTLTKIFGKKVDIPGYEEVDFFVISRGGYYVVHRPTGMMIAGPGKTIDEVITAAKTMMDQDPTAKQKLASASTIITEAIAKVPVVKAPEVVVEKPKALQPSKGVKMVSLSEIQTMLDGAKNVEELQAVRKKLLNYHAGNQLAVPTKVIAEMIKQREIALTKDVEKVDLEKGNILVAKDTTLGDISSRLFEVVDINKDSVSLRQMNTPEADAKVVSLKKLSDYEKYNDNMGYIEQKPPVTKEEKVIASENKTQNESFLADPAAVKQASDEAEQKSTKEVDDDFFNNIGCK